MDRELMVELYKVSSALVALINNQLRPYQLTFQQFMILHYLYPKKTKVIGKDICQYLGISHPTSVGLMTRMRGKGLIIMEVSEEDRRQTEVSLTAYGYEVYQQTVPIVDKIEAKIGMKLSSQPEFLASLIEIGKVLK